MTQIGAWNPELIAYKKLYEMEGTFAQGHLSKVGHIVIGYCLKDDPSRDLKRPIMERLDEELCAYFNDAPIGMVF